MAFPRTIRNFNVFVDGVSYFGRGRRGKLPVPKIMTSAQRYAGLDAPIGNDMGMEALTAEAEFAEWSPELLAHLGFHRNLVFRPAARGDNDQTVTSYIVTCRGLVTQSSSEDDLNPGEDSLLKLVIDLRYYKLEVDGRVIHDIDIENAVRIVNGTDQLQRIRQAMGI